VTFDASVAIGELALDTIWELGSIASDDSFRALCEAAEHEAAQLRAIAEREHADLPAAAARVELHLVRLDELLVVSARQAAQHCASIADGIARAQEWDAQSDHDHDFREALAVGRRLTGAAKLMA
jgi:hypothetical protein